MALGDGLSHNCSTRTTEDASDTASNDSGVSSSSFNEHCPGNSSSLGAQSPDLTASSVPSSCPPDLSSRQQFTGDENGLEYYEATRTNHCYRSEPRRDDGKNTQSRPSGESFRRSDNALKFPRISKPVELMRRSYDVVVIGSGYGGAIAASRLARSESISGRRPSVCVLERGNEKWPGEYPSSAFGVFGQVHTSGQFAPSWFPEQTIRTGDPTGMYHLIFGRGLNSIVCNALGGTSLINANVFLEADKGTLSMPVWPQEIRSDPGSLDGYYERARKVLQPEVYPDDWPQLPKVELLKKQAAAVGMVKKWRKVPQTTRFYNGPNSAGVEMSPSSLSGQDATGLNDGSKNSTLATYLADAWNWGAEMFCQCEVRYITKAKDREGYIIFFAWHGCGRGRFRTNFHDDLMWVHAKKCVVLGAGAIGTTEILLRSGEMGLPMGQSVGHNMSGNGDMMAFGYNTDYQINAVGRAKPSQYHPTGPTVNSVIDNREGLENPLDGYIIEEGSIPHALAPPLHALLEILPAAFVTPKPLFQRLCSSLARYKCFLFGSRVQNGSVDRTQVYLVMSHDSSQAALTLQDDKPILEFVGAGQSDQIRRLRNLLAKATAVVGGTFVDNPLCTLMGNQQLTVHPIGQVTCNSIPIRANNKPADSLSRGACMAADGTADTGVLSHAGELLTGRGRETHPGFIITDAAAIPAALGVNPFATIAALAERSVDLYIQRESLTVRQEKNGIIDLFGKPRFPRGEDCPEFSGSEDREIMQLDNEICRTSVTRTSGFGFTEVMTGFIHPEEGIFADERRVYESAYRVAKSLSESARLFLSVQSFSTSDTIRDPNHPAMLTGSFTCPSIPGSPFVVHRGDLSLFTLNHRVSRGRNLTYNFNMQGIDGRVFHFHGCKVVDSSIVLAPFQLWGATTTLYVTISETASGLKTPSPYGESWRPGKVVAKGIMHLGPSDLVNQVMSMTSTGASVFRKAYSTASFLAYFARSSLSLFIGPFGSLQYPKVSYEGYINDTPPDASFVITANDKVRTRLHVWESTNKNIETKNVFMIPGASVDHQIFALPTIPYNAVNYLTRAGYRIFIPVHRIGKLKVAEANWTTYDARLDLRACLHFIREHPEYKTANSLRDNKIYAIAHCMGSVAFSTGLLDGTIPSNWIMGITCSQTFMNPKWSAINLAKARMGVGPITLDNAYKALCGSWFSCSTSKNDVAAQKVVNQLLRLLPEERKEMCNNASCHRCTLVFGRCWNHANLNAATHKQIDRFFGGVNMTQLRLLMKQGSEGHVMSNGPQFERLTSMKNVQRLKGIPFLLFVGGESAVLSPEATVRTYEVLCETFGLHGGNSTGKRQYRRRIVSGYGHLDCWMGRNAWKDVYPFVREELDRVVRGEDYKFEEPSDRFAAMVQSGELLY